MRYTSRKFLYCVGLEALVTWLLVNAYVSEATWLSVSTAILTGYIIGNVGQKGIEQIAAAVQKYIASSKGAAPPAAGSP